MSMKKVSSVGCDHHVKTPTTAILKNNLHTIFCVGCVDAVNVVIALIMQYIVPSVRLQIIWAHWYRAYACVLTLIESSSSVLFAKRSKKQSLGGAVQYVTTTSSAFQVTA